MFVKPFVLNGNGRMDHGLRNLVQGCPLAVCGGMNLLQQLNISVAIHIVHKRGLIKIGILHVVVGLRQNILLQVIAQNSHKNKSANQADEQHRRSGAQRNLQDGPGGCPDSVKKLQ